MNSLSPSIISHSNYFLTTDGSQIFYGLNFDPNNFDSTRETVIFNYGLVCSNYHWRFQIPHFHELNFNIIIHDYRGHYQSTTLNKNSISFENIAIDLYQLIEHLQLRKTNQNFSCHLIGHSMGVNVCLELLKKFPRMFKSAVMISGTVMPVDNVMFDTNAMDILRPVFTNIYKKQPSLFGKIWRYGGWNPLMRKFIKFGGFNLDQVGDEFIEIYLNKMGLLGPDVFFNLLEQMQNQSILPFLSKITIPTLIVGGDQDKVIPNHLQKFLHSKITNSELYILRNGSHVPQADFPDLLNDRLTCFYQNLTQ